MYKQITEGKLPEGLGGGGPMEESHLDADGKPIVDAEGGAVIQPKAGFVVKTKDASGGKVFVNFTYHDAVEGMEDKPITEEDQAKYGTSDKGIRIPLSLGHVREDRDKKGDPVQVYDFVWNTKVVRDAQKDAGFRQSMVELAFNYIHQKFGKELDLRFTVPKMKYKGDTIQF